MHPILVIDEGNPGHLTQSRGLAHALAARSGNRVEFLRATLAARGVFRPLLRLATNLSARGLPDFALRWAYNWTGSLKEVHAEVIVASGGQGLYFATSLARRLGCPLVFCGDPAPLPACWCDVILSPVPIPAHDRVIQTELLVTEVSPASIAGRGAKFLEAGRQAGASRLGAVLVGGDSRSHRYTSSDWEALASGLNRLGERGWRWLISTSRRTPPPAEEFLRDRIEARYLVKAVWWHARPERVMLDFLGAADMVFVTQDSLSMLSEAMSAGKPVVSLVPAEVRPSDYIEAVLSAQEARRRMARVSLATFGDNDIPLEQFIVVEGDLVAEYASRVETLLRRDPSDSGKWIA